MLCQTIKINNIERALGVSFGDDKIFPLRLFSFKNNIMKTTKIILSILLAALSVWLLIFDTNPNYNWLRFFVIVTLISIPVAYAFGSIEFKRKPKPEDVIAPELLEFLKEKGVFEDFMSNYNDNRNAEWRKHWAYLDGITCAFDWEDTPQGCDYWNDLDDEYEQQQSK